MELQEELISKMRELDEAKKHLKKNALAKANAENEYKKELAKKCLELKADGMTNTMIQLTVHGTEPVAEYRLKRDIASEMRDAAYEFINVTKLQIRVLEDLLKLEWGESE